MSLYSLLLLIHTASQIIVKFKNCSHSFSDFRPGHQLHFIFILSTLFYCWPSSTFYQLVLHLLFVFPASKISSRLVLCVCSLNSQLWPSVLLSAVILSQPLLSDWDSSVNLWNTDMSESSFRSRMMWCFTAITVLLCDRGKTHISDDCKMTVGWFFFRTSHWKPLSLVLDYNYRSVYMYQINHCVME